MKTVKYSKYLQETSKNYRYIRFGKLDHTEEKKREDIDYTLKDALTIIKPHVKGVIPIALYLLLFQLIVMKQTVTGGQE